MDLALPGQVLEQREQAFEGLQQVEVGDIGDPRQPRRADTLGQVLGALAHQPGHFTQVAVQHRHRLQGHAGGVEMLVHYQAAIRALVFYPAYGNAGEGVAVIMFQSRRTLKIRKIPTGTITPPVAMTSI